MAGGDDALRAGKKGSRQPGVGIVPAGGSDIRNLIYTVRGQQVMLDSDLARLYGVETKRINEAVRRNATRFPDEFCFRATADELDNLRSQFATSKSEGTRGGKRYPPRLFTEQGVAMLSAVLRSEVAVSVSIKIMNSFVEMRRFFASNADMFEQVRAVELRQLEYQKSTDERFERVFDYMDAHETPRQKVFFDGEVFDAFEFLTGLVAQAERSIILVDGYADMATLNILAKKQGGVEVAVWTRPQSALSQRDVDAFNAQYPLLMIKRTSAFHDRFLILDGSECYLIGASLKDAGKRSFAIARIEDPQSVRGIIGRLEGQ